MTTADLHRWNAAICIQSRDGTSPWSSFSIFSSGKKYSIILSFVFTIKRMDSKLQKIKGHCVCLLKTLTLSLLTHPEKGHAIIYLIPPPSLHACIYTASQPASQAMNTLRGLRAVLWTTCAVFTWLSRERVRKTGTLKPNRCMIQRRELWRVNFLYEPLLHSEQTAVWKEPRKHLYALWLFPLISQNCVSVASWSPRQRMFGSTNFSHTRHTKHNSKYW